VNLKLCPEQCKQLSGVWDSSVEFRDAMVSPVLEPSAKKKALQSLLAEQGDAFADEPSEGSG
jgi:F0F1-type ATP synthase delta subunit